MPEKLSIDRFLFQKRPGDPWTKPHTKWNIVDMTWHHVLPMAMLRDCWNALVSHIAQSPKATVALQSYMRILAIDPGPTLRAMKNNAEFALIDELFQKVAWPAWNLIEGPSNRSDDAHSDQVLDKFTAGLTLAEEKVQGKIESLFAGMRIFNRASQGQKQMGAQAFQAVANVMNNMERGLTGHTRIAFRPEMWKLVIPPDWKPLSTPNPTPFEPTPEEWKRWLSREQWKQAQWKKAGGTSHRPPKPSPR